MTFGPGFLRKPAVKALLDRWTAEEEAARLRERNDQIYTEAIRNFFRRSDEEPPCR